MQHRKIFPGSFIFILVYVGILALGQENSSSTTNGTNPTPAFNLNLTKFTINDTIHERKGKNASSSDIKYKLKESENEPTKMDNEEEQKYAEYEEEASEEETEDLVEEKFVSKPNEITLEHIDFVQLRLRHIARSTSDNITELRELQEKELKVNEDYKLGWERAWKLYNNTKRWEIFKNVKNDSSILSVPEDYHVAIIAYSLADPAMYADFNKKTRQICSGKDIDDNYNYKSYFKLLLLAIKSLGNEDKFRSGNRFLYRGVGSLFKLEIGQVLAFQHFVSTSTSLKIAEDFAEHTLFEMEGPFQGTSMSIKDHSYYEGEEEVLFSPLQVFYVDSKHEGKHYTRYVLKAHNFMMEGALCGFEAGQVLQERQLKVQESSPNQSNNSGGETIIIIGKSWLILTLIVLLTRVIVQE